MASADHQIYIFQTSKQSLRHVSDSGPCRTQPSSWWNTIGYLLQTQISTVSKVCKKEFVILSNSACWPPFLFVGFICQTYRSTLGSSDSKNDRDVLAVAVVYVLAQVSIGALVWVPLWWPYEFRLTNCETEKRNNYRDEYQIYLHGAFLEVGNKRRRVCVLLVHIC